MLTRLDPKSVIRFSGFLKLGGGIVSSTTTYNSISQASNNKQGARYKKEEKDRYIHYFTSNTTLRPVSIQIVTRNGCSLPDLILISLVARFI
jgi:hypothetical protein